MKSQKSSTNIQQNINLLEIQIEEVINIKYSETNTYLKGGIQEHLSCIISCYLNIFFQGLTYAAMVRYIENYPV